MEAYFEYFENKFKKIANHQKALHQKKYMRNQFEYYGFSAQVRHKIVNQFLKNIKFIEPNILGNEINLMWRHDYRDMQYVAMEILAKYQKKHIFDNLNFIEFMITTKSWWDTVDFIATNIVFNYFNSFPEQIHKTIDKWVESSNLWLQRSSIIFQLKAKTNTDLDLLFSIIQKLEHINNFFIQKAIGWALREYSKTNPQIIVDYINKNNLSNLANRESLKFINRKTL